MNFLVQLKSNVYVASFDFRSRYHELRLEELKLVRRYAGNGPSGAISLQDRTKLGELFDFVF
jgi:hypothetical protein